MATLEQIKQLLTEQDEANVLSLSRQVLATVSPEERESYARRLGRALVSTFDWEPAVLRQFRKVLDTFPEDPSLLRVMAVYAERESPEDALEFWDCYVEELPHVKVIPPRLQARARALIWQRMGDIAGETERIEEGTPALQRPPLHIMLPACYPTAPAQALLLARV